MLPIAMGDACLKKEIAKIKMTLFYNCKGKERPLKKGDLVLRKTKATGKGPI